MPDRTAARTEPRPAWARACTALLRVLYVGTAMLGLLVTPPLVSLVLAPVLAGATVVLLAPFVWYLEGHWPARDTLTTAAVAAAALLPFAWAVEALQAVGSAVAVTTLALLTVAAVDRVGQGPHGPGRPPVPRGTGTDGRVHELLQAPVGHLLAQWRALQHPGAQTAAAAALRTLLLDELQRRDPDAFASWLSSGAAGPPDEHFCRDTGSAS